MVEFLYIISDYDMVVNQTRAAVTITRQQQVRKLFLFNAKKINARQGRSVRKQSEPISNTWQTDPIASIMIVADSLLKTSFGAGTANQIKFGSITVRLSRSNLDES